MIKSKIDDNLNMLQDTVSSSTESPPEPNVRLNTELEAKDIYALLCTTPPSSGYQSPSIKSPSSKTAEQKSIHIYNRDRSNANVNKNIGSLQIRMPILSSEDNKNNQGILKSPKTKMFKIRNESKYLSPKAETPESIDLSIKNGTKSVFIGIRNFFQNWRRIKSQTLYESIVILPNIYVEWILNPDQYKIEFFQDIFDDDVFIKTLQWKHHQKLVICNIMDKNQNLKTIKMDSMKSEPELTNVQLSENSILPFWKNLSSKLIDFKLNPLIFTDKYYRSKLYKSKFEVKGQDIIDSFTNSSSIKPLIIKEILYQSNPRLNVFINYTNITSQSYSNLLEELSIKGADTLLLQKQLEEEEIEMKYNRLKNAYYNNNNNYDQDDIDQIGVIDVGPDDDDNEWLDDLLVDIDGKMLNDMIWPTNSAKDSLNITPFTSAKYYNNSNNKSNTASPTHSYYPSINGIKSFKPISNKLNTKGLHSKKDSMLSTDSWWMSPNY